MAAVAQSAVQRVELIPPPAFSVPQGRPTVITLHFHVLPGFHINSDKPLSELLLATNLKLDPPGDIALGHIRFPEGKLMSFPFAQEEKLSVYSGDFEVKVTVFTTRGTKPGPYRTRGTLQYQACNDRQCFAPKSLPFTFDVKVLRSRN
jgi:hypothetical protein